MQAETEPKLTPAIVAINGESPPDSITGLVSEMAQDYMTKFKVGLLVLGAVIGLIAFKWGLLVAAKIIVTAIFLGIALFCFAIVFFKDWIMVNLMEVEEIGYLLHDETVMNCAQARQGLAILREKIISSQQTQPELLPEVIKYAGPLVTMLVNKERSAMSWAMFGFRVAKSAYQIMKQRK